MDMEHGPASAPDDAMPALRRELLAPPDLARLEPLRRADHPPRILLLYGSLRERSYSRLLVEEAARLLKVLGAEARIFDPRELPIAGSVGPNDPKVQELRALSVWSEGQVWCSPEMHGEITGAFKNQIDWLPLELGDMHPTQGRTLAVMQVSSGSQRFNSVDSLRLLGCWMRMVAIPNELSIPMVHEQFDDAGRLRPGLLYDRVVDVMEELVHFTWLLRDRADTLMDRYSERLARIELPTAQ